MINWIITSSVLILIVAFLRFLLRGKISLRLQYALWAIVLIRLLFPFEYGATDLSLLNAVENVPVVQEIESMQGVDSIEHTQSGAVEGYYGLIGDEVAVVAENKTDEEFSRMKTALSLRNILMPLWKTGVAVILFVFIFSNCKFAGELKASRTKKETELSKLPVYITDKVDTPCLFGLIHPAIYLTEEAAKQDHVLRHTVEHETTHFYHKDHLWAVLRCLAIAIHWYNPLVWWAAKLSRDDAELACDEATLIRLGDSERASYGRTLLSVTCEKHTDFLKTATTMTGSGKGIMERIALIAKKPKTAVYTLVTVVIVAAVATICTFTGAKEKPASFEEWTSSVTAENIQWAETAKEYGIEVIDYAKEYVYRRVEEYNEIGMYSGYTIVSARISNMEQISTGTAAENDGVNLYRLEYRLLPDSPEAVELVDGMKMDGDEITEWGSAGQPYLLVHYEHRFGTEVWTPICWTHTEVIDVEYSTPEMIEEYGNPYTAAAMELWKAWSYRQENETPAAAADVENALSELMKAGEPVSFMLSTENEGDFDAYAPSDEWFIEHLKLRFHEFQWKEMKEHQESGSYSVTLSDAGGTHRMVFFEDDTVAYFDGNHTTYWRAECQDYPSHSIAKVVCERYNYLDTDAMGIKFYLDGSAESAVKAFTHEAYGSHLMSLAPGNESGISEYKVVSWDVLEVSEDGNAAVGEFSYAFVPLYPDSVAVWAGNTGEGTGAYEGMLVAYKQVVLERKEDGYWHCTGLGTGGYRLPE